MAATTRREWAIAIGGGLGLAMVLVAILRPGAVTAPAAEPALPVATPPTTPPASAPPAPPQAPPPAPPAAPAITTDLALTGLRTGPDGGMAIIRAGDRHYRLTPGRRLPGGLALLRTEPGRAILSGPGGEQVLAFAEAPTASAAPASAAAAVPGGDPTPWRLALTPVKDDNQVIGWRLGNPAALPQLAGAGLKSGDILTSANGQPLLTEEKIIDLPQELAMNGRLAIAYRRAGVTQTANVVP